MFREGNIVLKYGKISVFFTILPEKVKKMSIFFG